jgi:hypothetical protein
MGRAGGAPMPHLLPHFIHRIGRVGKLVELLK